ncbi:hypothetical protein GQ55_2G371500 [Panicum hallii var. hallii]|uniref:Uncharacterized protein n=1 Tax=Panicum hallii var. hallii TaxID=1504633 RepID=A0A2T7EWF6_9POAL|nr:hypothetical protein GQ55_2G371500 [Panicum hallii var. hallii]
MRPVPTPLLRCDSRALLRRDAGARSAGGTPAPPPPPRRCPLLAAAPPPRRRGPRARPSSPSSLDLAPGTVASTARSSSRRRECEGWPSAAALRCEVPLSARTRRRVARCSLPLLLATLRPRPPRQPSPRASSSRGRARMRRRSRSTSAMWCGRQAAARSRPPMLEMLPPCKRRRHTMLQSFGLSSLLAEGGGEQRAG